MLEVFPASLLLPQQGIQQGHACKAVSCCFFVPETAGLGLEVLISRPGFGSTCQTKFRMTQPNTNSTQGHG
jgi:hypothetical protein